MYFNISYDGNIFETKKRFERLILKMSILTIYVILVTHRYHKKVMSLIPKDGSEKFVTTGCTVSTKKVYTLSSTCLLTKKLLHNSWGTIYIMEVAYDIASACQIGLKGVISVLGQWNK